MFDISPTEEVGDFDVKAKFMGVEMEKVQLHFQVNSWYVRHSITKMKAADLNLNDRSLNVHPLGPAAENIRKQVYSNYNLCCKSSCL